MEEIKRCEVISIHTPLTFSGTYPTYNMVNKSFLENSKAKTIINTSRGSIVNEKDLLELSHINYISDVWENEPSPDIDIIKKAIIATPHIAGHSYEGKINGTINLLLALFEVIEISKENLAKNIKFISDVSKKKLTNNSLGLNDFSNSYNVVAESKAFKELSNKSDKYIAAADFERARRMHKMRHDIF